MNESKKTFWSGIRGIVTLWMIIFVGYFIFIGHKEHIFELLPYLIILLCPLMHIFMHGGHGHSHHHESESEAYRRGLEDGRNEVKTGPE